jgi:uncharacterized protein YgbK (DUF1537 family)
MLLGCIGDDFTGSADLANTLAKQGMQTVLFSGVPMDPAASETEAGVVALKVRSVDPQEAIGQALDAVIWLQAQGCTQFLFKYCSTFDSTQEGNIGPVTDALADHLGAEKVIICPAFPGTGRSVYQGHLFVNDRLLNESGMENHPLTPMTDADIRRLLKPQTRHSVGHVAAQTVLTGAEAIKTALEAEHMAGHRLIVVDALQDHDLMQIGQAASDLILITGGSGIALGLPANFKKTGHISETQRGWAGLPGKCVALSGSCSTATRAQVLRHLETHPGREITAADVMAHRVLPQDVVDWAMACDGIPLIYSSADPQAVLAAQAEFGLETLAAAIEEFFARTARSLRSSGVCKLVTAGGETSGAIVEGLALAALEIGPEIDPGVPALRAGPDLNLALKSGNFGTPDFFSKAAAVLEGRPQ